MVTRREEMAAAFARAVTAREDVDIRDIDQESQGESRRGRPMQRFSDALAVSPIAREAIGLSALVVAYLQYYYLDVQFKIMSLPSVTAFPLQ
ncbi:MAG: hypothetical protein JJE42_19465 [Burkholderiales bacterium]|nr:hypothetical protein [Burkholderiales bacterium]